MSIYEAYVQMQSYGRPVISIIYRGDGTVIDLSKRIHECHWYWSVTIFAHTSSA